MLKRTAPQRASAAEDGARRQAPLGAAGRVVLKRTAPQGAVAPAPPQRAASVWKGIEADPLGRLGVVRWAEKFRTETGGMISPVSL